MSVYALHLISSTTNTFPQGEENDIKQYKSLSVFEGSGTNKMLNNNLLFIVKQNTCKQQ